MAIEGKTMQHMPSDIRRDMTLRDYYQQGWEQATEDVGMAQAEMKKPNWRKRFIWFSVMVLGGLATGAHIIDLYESERTQQQVLISSETDSSSAEATQLSNQTNSPATKTEELSLLNTQQRQDLKLTQAQASQNTNTPLKLEAISPSTITINNAVLAQDVVERKPVDVLTDKVPKYIREVYFFTEINQAQGQTLYHRWRTANEILATIEFKVNSERYRTWSSKKMASAWVGQWYVEVLDQEQNVIYRKAFEYTNQASNPEFNQTTNQTNYQRNTE